MEETPSWEANMPSASREIPCIHSSLQLVHILKQINPFHTHIPILNFVNIVRRIIFIIKQWCIGTVFSWLKQKKFHVLWNGFYIC